jgi:hypothetical protein
MVEKAAEWASLQGLVRIQSERYHKSAGKDGITASYPGDTNYRPLISSAASATVNKATLTVTAINLSKVYGATLPALTYTLSVFVNGDTAATATTGTPKLATAATAATAKSPVGSYPIAVTAGTLAGANYSLEFKNGILTAQTLGTVATPTFSPAVGTHTSAQSVTIGDTTTGATIYYTTNGAALTTSSTKYTVPIKVSATETIKAIPDSDPKLMSCEKP